MSEHKFPSEVIDLPSEGKLYPKEHPCSSGKLELKYMTAKEEDILTSANLIQKGLAIDKLLDSLILTKGVKVNDLLLGDKNAVMVAARILAYGPEYSCQVVNPNTGDTIEHTFNLADCPFQKLDDNITENNFEFELPISKTKVTFKVLNGGEEKLIEKEIESNKKIGSDVVPELTTRLRHVITSVDGSSDASAIANLSNNILARDSLMLRRKMASVVPDIKLKQEISIGGDVVEVDIPLTTEFFWPKAI